MNTTAAPTPHLTINVSDFLTLGLVALAIAMIAGFRLPWLVSPRTALIALFIAGFAICTGGIGRVSSINAWTHPLAIFGYLIGFAIIVIAVAAFLNKPLPMISNDRSAFIAITGLIGLKWVISQIFWLTHM